MEQKSSPIPSSQPANLREVVAWQVDSAAAPCGEVQITTLHTNSARASDGWEGTCSRTSDPRNRRPPPPDMMSPSSNKTLVWSSCSGFEPFLIADLQDGSSLWFAAPQLALHSSQSALCSAEGAALTCSYARPSGVCPPSEPGPGVSPLDGGGGPSWHKNHHR